MLQTPDDSLKTGEAKEIRPGPVLAAAAKPPLFSVVIPLFNRAHLIEDTLQSVFDQTFSDFEIIIVDDGSSDNPEKVIRAIRDKRIRLVRQVNQGGGAARNAGIDLACGSYVAFLDSDDRFLPHHLETMKSLLNGKAGLAAYARIVVDRGSGITFLKPPRGIRNEEHMALYLMCDRGFVQTSTLVVPVKWARAVRYNPTLPFSQDTDFAIRLYNAGCRFIMTDQPGAIWRDISDAGRVSAGRKADRVVAWLETLRPMIPPKAFWGYSGWHVAKSVALESRSRALALFLKAVVLGCYDWKLATKIFCQIMLPDTFYRRLGDYVIRRGKLHRSKTKH